MVGGVSAGGSIAASLTIDCRDRGRDDIAALLLEVPVVDVRDDGIWLPEYAALNGFTTLAELRGAYCADGGRGVTPQSPRCSPIFGAFLPCTS